MTSPYMYIADRKADRRVYWAWGALIWLLGLAPAARAAVYSRKFGAEHTQSVVSVSSDQGGLARWLELGVTGLAFGLGGMSLLLGLAFTQGRLPKAGLGLWLGAMAFALGPLLSSRFGLRPDLSLALFGLPVVFTAVYLLPSVPLNWFVSQVKKILLFYVYGSLLAALVVPGWAMESPYTEGLIPGFNVRLHGLASHANLLSPLLLTYFVLSWLSPSKTRWERFHQMVALLALVLTQSKTVWILFIVACLIHLAFTAWRLPGLQRYTALAFLGAIFSGVSLYLATGPTWLDSLGGFFSGEQGERLTTLTGRTLIWRVTWSLWEQNPLFGYGPRLWDSEMGQTYAPVIGFVASHSHSQVYESLGQAGIIGLAGFFLYAITLLAYGVRHTKVTNGVALILVSVMLLRGINEPPLRANLGDSQFYIHFLTFAFLMLVSRWKSSTLDEKYREAHRAQRLPVLARDGPPATKQTGRT